MINKKIKWETKICLVKIRNVALQARAIDIISSVGYYFFFLYISSFVLDKLLVLDKLSALDKIIIRRGQ